MVVKIALILLHAVQERGATTGDGSLVRQLSFSWCSFGAQALIWCSVGSLIEETFGCAC